MNSIISVGGLVLLALVLFEVQSFARAFIFSFDWPADVRVTHTSLGLRPQVGREMTTVDRLRLAVSQYAYCSLLLHEFHRTRHGEKPLFKTSMSLAFGGLVVAFGFSIGQSLAEACSLGLCSAAVLFAASQARGVLKTYALWQESEKLLQSLQSDRRT